MHVINYKSCFLTGIFIFFFIFSSKSQSYFIYGEIKDSLTSLPISESEIYNVEGKLLSTSNSDGYFQFYTSEESLDIFLFAPTYTISKNRINVKDSTFFKFFLEPIIGYSWRD
jgi:hypothetical protein